MKLTLQDIDNILRLIDSPCVELHLETADFKLFVRKAVDSQSTTYSLAVPSAPVPGGGNWQPTTSDVTGAPVAPETTTAPVPQRALAEGERAIVAPMVGTFYRAPAPDAEPFVAVGDVIEPDTVVCIIEVMKLMNSIRAECRGRVVEILVQNAQSVQSGQPLIIIGPPT